VPHCLASRGAPSNFNRSVSEMPGRIARMRSAVTPEAMRKGSALHATTIANIAKRSQTILVTEEVPQWRISTLTFDSIAGSGMVAPVTQRYCGLQAERDNYLRFLTSGECVEWCTRHGIELGSDGLPG
jgi:hypothetical protein